MHAYVLSHYLCNHLSDKETHNADATTVDQLGQALTIGHFEVARLTGSRWLSSALWDCFGDAFSTRPQIRPPKRPTILFDNHL